MQGPTPQDRMAEFDVRLSRIEGIVEQMNTRLINLENSVAGGQRWIIGIQFTTLLYTMVRTLFNRSSIIQKP